MARQFHAGSAIAPSLSGAPNAEAVQRDDILWRPFWYSIFLAQDEEADTNAMGDDCERMLHRRTAAVLQLVEDGVHRSGKLFLLGLKDYIFDGRPVADCHGMQDDSMRSHPAWDVSRT